LWMLIKDKTGFHNHHLGASIRHGFHALALHETRNAFAPVLWDCPPGWEGNVEQVWFRGAHGDVGGQVGDMHQARPLANIPLVWMLDRAEAVGLPLPMGWRGRFATDATAPLGQVFPGAPQAPPAARPVGTAAPDGWPAKPGLGAGLVCAAGLTF